MRRDKALTYAAFAGGFFGVALSVSILTTEWAIALAVALLGVLAGMLAIIANDEAGWP